MHIKTEAYILKLLILFILSFILLISPSNAKIIKFKPLEKPLIIKNKTNVYNKKYRVLSIEDINTYKNIFYLQKRGQWENADTEIDNINDDILLGHVLFQRYMHPNLYRSSYNELSNWMKLYSDHPGANRIYKLAKKRKYNKNLKLNQPTNHSLSLKKEKKISKKLNQNKVNNSYKIDRRNNKEKRRARKFISKIRSQIKREILTKSENELRKKSSHNLNKIEVDQLLWEIANVWFIRGDNDKKAYTLASEAANRSRIHVEIADWTAGLASWRMDNKKEAQFHFEKLAKSNTASPWNKSAGAFWAARANLLNNNPENVKYWLKLGARFDKTFYGLLAKRYLGKKSKFISKELKLENSVYNQLIKHKPILRSLALSQIDKKYLADREIYKLIKSSNEHQKEDLLKLATTLDLPNSTLHLGLKSLEPSSPYYNTIIFPIPKWYELMNAYVDRALILAFVKQESNFNSYAKSPAGARGLMQLMPRTASFVASDRSLRFNKLNSLYETQLNLRLGSKYITYLMQDSNIKDNLFFIATAYNAGPNNLSKWLKKTKYYNDPLLFIESIPSKETRLFVERIMTNFWIYRMRFGQKTPSLDDVLEGRWPQYKHFDKK